MIMKLLTFCPERREPMPPDRVLRSSWRVGRWSVTMIQHLEVKSSNGLLTTDNEHALGDKSHIQIRLTR
jgi:hypothetical protein